MGRKREINGLTKTEVKEMVYFALDHLPQLDEITLEAFLERIKTNCPNRIISPRDLAKQMRLTRRFMPDACAYSLQILADLLDIQMKNPRATASFLALGVFASEKPSANYAF